MRLGRPLAAASAVAVMAGASLVASPALANDSNGSSADSPSSSSSSSPSESSPTPSEGSSSSSSPSESSPTPSEGSSSSSGPSENSSFRIIQKKTFASASTNTSFTISGAGCTGQQATVGIALYTPDGSASDVVKTKADSDGSWSTDVDIASLIKSIGSTIDPGTDGWTIGASCMTYGGQTDTTPVTSQQQTPIFFDDTRITGSYEVSTGAEGGSQTFSFNAHGFYAGEKVSVVLKNKNDAGIQYALGELTVDASGSLQGTLPAPADAADGEYLLVLTGSHHDETAASQTLTTVSNHVFTIKDNGGAEDKTSTGGGTESSSTGEQQTAEPGKASGNPGGDHADHDHQASGGLGPAESPESTENSNVGSDNDDRGRNTETGQRTNSQVRDGNSGKEPSSHPKAADNGKSLAQTGANSLIFGGIAALLVVIGGGVLLLRRRSRN